MKIVLTLFLGLLTTVSAFSMTPKHWTVEREDGKTYVSDGENRVRIDPTTVVAEYKSDITDLNHIKNYTVLHKNIVSIPVPNDMKVEDFMKYLESSEKYEDLNYNYIGLCHFIPNDSYVGNQWYLNEINAYSAWNITTGCSSVKVAVI